MPLIVPATRGPLSAGRDPSTITVAATPSGRRPPSVKEGGMYARSMTLSADPKRIDAGITTMQNELMPTVLETDGCIGLSFVCDRDSGRCIAATSWDSEAAMAASRESLRPVRGRLTEVMGAGDYQLQDWDIAAMHRLHPPGDDACARLTWTRGDPATMDRTIDTLRMSLVPRMDDLPGFCSMSLMVDRATGAGVLTAVYRDRAAMDESRPMVMAMREEFTSQMGMEVTEVAEFDLAIHHLRAPELV
jgi:quinol monooxygenase YgiN